MHKTDMLDVLARKLAPFILLFGCYLITYGHLSPGGGFQGGVVLASGMMLLLLSRGVASIQEFFPFRAISAVEVIGFLAFLAVGFVGFVVGGHFLRNFMSVSVGESVELPHSGFIFLLNLIIGVKVGAGMTLMCYYLLKDE